MNAPLEIERKYLIACPDEAALRKRCTAVYDMEQIYLLAPEGVTERVRRRRGEREEFFHTAKERLTDRTCVEREEIITAAQYEALLERRDPSALPLLKRRYCLPCEGHVFEIDIYPFWHKVAVMEVELQSEEEPFTVPEDIRVLREVTGEWYMKNAALARSIPDEDTLVCAKCQD